MRKRPKHANLVSPEPIQTCILCDKDYCDMHKGSSHRVCEINHATYWRNHPEKQDTYPDVEAREAALKQAEENEKKEGYDSVS